MLIFKLPPQLLTSKHGGWWGGGLFASQEEHPNVSVISCMAVLLEWE